MLQRQGTTVKSGLRAGTFDRQPHLTKLRETVLVLLMFHFVFFETESHYVAKTGLELTIVLPQPPKCWNYWVAGVTAIPRLPGELLKEHISSSEGLIHQKEHDQDSKDHCPIAQGPQGETPGLGSGAQPKGDVVCLLILGKSLSHSARQKELTRSLSRVNKHL